MNVEISRLPFKSLWNTEYTLFVNQVVAIIEKYDSRTLHLQKSFDKVKSQLPDLAKIKAQEKSNALSNQLQELDAERDTLIVAIVAQVKAMGRLSLPGIAPHVVVLDRFFDQHGRDIASANYNAETERLNDLLADYNAKDDVKAAAQALNLTMLFDQLGLVNTQFAALFLQRTEGDAATEKVDARAIRTLTDKALNAFFVAFEYCSSEYDGLDYITPASELNELIAYYKTQLKARATRRNSGKDVSVEEPIG
jgi:vacuolar-type H+-ATPase subunit I/STV1